MIKRISIQQNLINHVGFVFDASYSMSGKEKELVRVADELIEFLKEKSQQHNQETRVTMYIFGSDTQVACYDIDVLRSPSIASFYEAAGPSTALVDATYTAITEMQQTATLHGDHAFLLYVLTDGYENSSTKQGYQLSQLMKVVPNNWTIAGLVPDKMSQRSLLNYGFHLENTMIWDATTVQGVAEAGTAIQQATANYYEARSQGIRSTTGLFNLNTQNLTKSVVHQTLKELSPSDYFAFTVSPDHIVIKDAVESNVGQYRQGSTYYQLTKSETVQPQKDIAVREKRTGKIYRGRQARQILGLPDYHTKVAPAKAPDYDIFIQSTSSNRKLVPGTTAIVIK